MTTSGTPAFEPAGPATTTEQSPALDDVLPVFVRLAAHQLGVPLAYLVLHGEGGEVVHGAPGEAGLTTVALPEEPLLVAPLAAGREIAVADVSLDAELAGEPGLAALGATAFAGSPVMDAEGRALGAICVIDAVVRVWTLEERSALRDLAQACAAQLRAQAEKERARRVQNLVTAAHRHNRLLLLMSEAFLEATTVDDVASTVAYVASTGLGATYSGIALLDGPHSQAISYRGGLHLGGEEGAGAWERGSLEEGCPLSHVIRTRQALFFADSEELLQAFPEARLRGDGGGGRAFLPISAGGKLFGAMILQWALPRVFETEGKAVKTALAAYSAHALDRALLLEHRQEVAQTLQAAMLTDLPHSPGLELASRYLPATETDQVGGDWCDAVALPNGSTVVMIGDVTGHDMHAAASMGQLRSMLRAYAWNNDELPSHLLERLDRTNRGLELDIMATALVGRLDRDHRGVRFRWSNAGHLPPLLVRRDGTAEFLEAKHDLMLGVVPTCLRADHEVSLQEGDLLILYTDGLVERRTRTLRQGMEVLRAALTGRTGITASDLAGAALEEVAEGHLADDVAVLAIRVCPEASTEAPVEVATGRRQRVQGDAPYSI